MGPEIRRIENNEHFAEIRDRIRAQIEAGGPAQPSASSAGGGAAQVLRSLAKDLRERCAGIGQMPPIPSTLRGRVGAVLVGAVRWALFWYTPRLAEMHHLTAGALAEIAGTLEQTGAALDQSRAANAELAARFENRLAQAGAALEQSRAANAEQAARFENRLAQAGAALEQCRDANAELAAKCEGLDERCRQLDGAIEVRRRREAALTQELRVQMTGQADAVGELRRELQELRQALPCEKHAEQMTALEGARADVAAELGRLRQVERTLSHLRRAINAQERRLAILIEEARRGGGAGPRAAHALGDADHPALEALYVSLQDDFRGTREEIKDRLQVYLPLLAEAGAGMTARVLDLGCGRGEWLELLRERSLNASGVDSNHGMVRLCRELSLDVEDGDAIAHLRALPPASIGAVTAFHVLEHLGLTEVLNLLDEALRVLVPGGLAIFETPNPECVSVSTHTFYLDPTHHHPLPALLSRFLLEARGYWGVEILYLHPCSPEQWIEESGSEVARRFNQQFYGPRDYAVIGRKPGPAGSPSCGS